MTKNEIMVMSKDELFSKETIIQAFEEESAIDRQIILNTFLERAKELRSAREMQSLIKAFKDELESSEKSNNKKAEVSRMTDFGHPNGEMLCGGWIADSESIWIPTLIGEKIACYHPIMPIARLKNMQTNTEKIVITFKRDYSWHEITVDKSVTISASKIVKLGEFGVMVTSETAKALVQYLADLESLNEIPLNHSTSKFGWIGNEFIPFDQDIVFDDESRFKDLSNSLIARGSYDIWLDLAKRIRQNKEHYEPQIYMAASFASVLVKPLNMLPFIVNLWGSTGKGKTVALMMAASIWADPAENKYITDSYSTQNAFEIRLDILNHLPLLMDDLSKVRDKLNENFTDLIYLLCSGKGKDRSNVDLGLNKVKTWQNSILSNMERPLANDTMRGGAINRILDFQMKDGYIFENGNAVVEVLRDNYGFAGRAFIELIKSLGMQYIADMRKDFERQIKEEATRQESVKEEKQILPLSLMLTADKIATDNIFKDGIYLDLAEMVSQLKDINEVSENERAYQSILDTVTVNSQKFDPDESYKGEIWGFIKDGYVNIVPLIFRKIAENENFSVKGFCEWAKSKGLLKSNNKNQNVIRSNGNIKRYYTIKIENETDGEDVFVELGDQEIPFD